MIGLSLSFKASAIQSNSEFGLSSAPKVLDSADYQGVWKLDWTRHP